MLDGVDCELNSRFLECERRLGSLMTCVFSAILTDRALYPGMLKSTRKAMPSISLFGSMLTSKANVPNLSFRSSTASRNLCRTVSEIVSEIAYDSDEENAESSAERMTMPLCVYPHTSEVSIISENNSLGEYLAKRQQKATSLGLAIRQSSLSTVDEDDTVADSAGAVMDTAYETAECEELGQTQVDIEEESAVAQAMQRFRAKPKAKKKKRSQW